MTLIETLATRVCTSTDSSPIFDILAWNFDEGALTDFVKEILANRIEIEKAIQTEVNSDIMKLD